LRLFERPFLATAFNRNKAQAVAARRRRRSEQGRRHGASVGASRGGRTGAAVGASRGSCTGDRCSGILAKHT
jgi:hypothetical protein